MKRIRMFVDILMYILFIILMGHNVSNNFIHEILGTILFILFIIHTKLNFHFYKNLFKGKYNKKRIIMTAIDLILLISMISIIISSVIISKEVFKAIQIGSKDFGRKLHTMSTSWAYIIMNIHVGIHISHPISKINKKFKNHTLEYVYYLVVAIICVYGTFCLIKSNLIRDMLLLNKNSMYNVNETWIIFYVHLLFASLLIMLITGYLNINKERNKNNEKE